MGSRPMKRKAKMHRMMQYNHKKVPSVDNLKARLNLTQREYIWVTKVILREMFRFEVSSKLSFFFGRGFLGEDIFLV